MDDAERIHRETEEIEYPGEAWAKRSDEYLVGYVAQPRQSQFHTPAIVEMQRRLAAAFSRRANALASRQNKSSSLPIG
jgi:hypothetical protein